MRNVTLFAIIIVVTACALAFTTEQRDSASSRPAAEAAIRATDGQTLRAAQEGDVSRIVQNYSNDADWLPPNAPLAHGREAIRAGWSQLLAAPGFHIDWRITHIDVSRSGDFAYTIYHYHVMMKGADGKPGNDDGKDLVVWRKQQDGSWKMIAESFNSNLPAGALRAQFLQEHP